MGKSISEKTCRDFYAFETRKSYFFVFKNRFKWQPYKIWFVKIPMIRNRTFQQVAFNFTPKVYFFNCLLMIESHFLILNDSTMNLIFIHCKIEIDNFFLMIFFIFL